MTSEESLIVVVAGEMGTEAANRIVEDTTEEEGTKGVITVEAGEAITVGHPTAFTLLDQGRITKIAMTVDTVVVGKEAGTVDTVEEVVAGMVAGMVDTVEEVVVAETVDTGVVEEAVTAVVEEEAEVGMKEVQEGAGMRVGEKQVAQNMSLKHSLVETGLLGLKPAG